MFRVGFGYDVHRLIEGRALVLGGVTIPHPTGLSGHSDADVLTHAIMDGILGALGKGDIGQHFPDTDPTYKDMESLSMLKTVMGLTKHEGFRINNLDCTVVAEKPKLAPYIPAMKQRLSKILEVEENQVNIKATTTEGLGFCGRGEGMAAYAVASITDTKTNY